MDRASNANLLHLHHAEPNPFSRPTTPGGGTHGTQIGFCGLGAMGYPMVRNLAKWRKQHVPGALPILVWNRTRSKAEQIAKEVGEDMITIALSLEQMASECDVIFTNLSNDEVVKDVYNQFARSCSVSTRSWRPLLAIHMHPCKQTTQISKGRIFVETSTIYPSVAGDYISTLLMHGRPLTLGVLQRNWTPSSLRFLRHLS